jgi:hypothetical protein
MLLAMAVSGGHAHAQDTISGHLLRIDTSTGFEGIEFDNGVEDDRMAGFAAGGSVTYQTPIGLYAHIGHTKYGMSSLKTFDRGIAGINEKESERVAGLGYRFQVSDSKGIFLGLGYSKSEVNWEYSSDSFYSTKLFWQKDIKQQYGLISISHNGRGNLSSTSVEGRYVWFFGRSDWGMGLSWTFAEGKYEAQSERLDMSQRAVGVVFMYRPVFGS